jgi:hypothetical protein
MAYTTIKKPSDYFNTKLYTGNGSTQSITGVGFQPDLIWFKVRSEAGSHRIVNAVRGNTKYLYSNAQDAEATVTTNVTSFDSDGFSLGNGSVNENTRTYASWNWLGGNGTVTNTDGATTSTVSLNSTAGFSIVNYVGTGSATTVGHGLGSTPDFIMAKGDIVNNWVGYSPYLGNNSGLSFNDPAGFTGSHLWNNTDPTDTVFSLGTVGATNNNGTSNTAYCFKSVKGYSKFGSYVGNGSTDGTFVYTGFKPAFIMVKRTDNAIGGSWIMYDTKRNPYNVSDIVLAANDNSSEAGWGYIYDLDILSNGFKWRHDGSSNYVNVSGASYIYMAFAEEPLVGDNPCTAR